MIFYYLFFIYLFIRVQWSSTTDDDEKWTAMYGNDPLRSGVWDYLTSISNDEEKMKNISFQAHQKCFNLTPKITFANFTIKELHYPDNFNFKPIKLDVLVYTAEGRYQSYAPHLPYYFYLTKGLKPNCVYYVIPYKVNNSREFTLLDHICDLVMPSSDVSSTTTKSFQDNTLYL